MNHESARSRTSVSVHLTYPPRPHGLDGRMRSAVGAKEASQFSSEIALPPQTRSWLAAAAARASSRSVVSARPSAVVMKPERLGTMPQCPLSFSRQLLTDIRSWSIDLRASMLNPEGHGRCIYRIETPDGHIFDAVVFSGRRRGPSNERAFETNWDILVWLFDGPASATRIDAAERENARLVVGTGRAGPDVLSWTRGNRSGRLFDTVVSSLAEGIQPDITALMKTGYLMRNVYYQANGMNGTRLFASYPADHPLAGAYKAQMLGIFLMREFSLYLAEFIAAQQSRRATTLDPVIRRYLGIGNSSGLGLNLLVWNHPMLLSRWLQQREALFGALRELERPDSAIVDRYISLLGRYATHVASRAQRSQASREHDATEEEILSARDLWRIYRTTGAVAGCTVMRPWKELWDALSGRISVAAQEALLALSLEVYPDLVETMKGYSETSEREHLDARMPVNELRQILRRDYEWAFRYPLDESTNHWIWYQSQEGEEPRRGIAREGYVAPEMDVLLKLPLGIRRLDDALRRRPARERVGRFLALFPLWHDVIERIQTVNGYPYHTPMHDLHAADEDPLHLVRFVLCALKGMTAPEAVGGLWMRGVFLQGAPTAGDLASGASDWIYPAAPQV